MSGTVIGSRDTAMSKTESLPAKGIHSTCEIRQQTCNKQDSSGIHTMNKIKEVNVLLRWGEVGAALAEDEGLLRRNHWSWNLHGEKRAPYKDLGNACHKREEPKAKRPCDQNQKGCVPEVKSVTIVLWVRGGMEEMKAKFWRPCRL